jgi:dTDP-4-dehydrorhamnose reductase
MKILILGGGGMLGHRLWHELHRDFEVWVTLRKPVEQYARHGLFQTPRTIPGMDVTHADHLLEVFRKVRPEAVVNCVGIIKQLGASKDPVASLTINSLLPHRLSRLCEFTGSRLVHVSTDCVFSGDSGNYKESDVSDAVDLYGRTKYLGEVTDPHCVTLRTSIVGREIETRLGLIEWFLSQRGQVIRGFNRAVFSGLTTPEFARVIRRVITRERELLGVWQVSSQAISKHDLLVMASRWFGWDGAIVPDDSVICDRSLDSTLFRGRTGYQPPGWEEMLGELAGLSPDAASHT